MKECKCLNCGKSFEKVRNTQGKYCSNSCQGKYQSKHRYEKWKRGDGKIGKHALKTNLIEEFGNICSVCDISDWNGNPLTMELDHIDGDPYNNTPENIRLICPNCHSQTETYKAKNIGNGRSSNKGKGWLLEKIGE
tara:strand:+ start:98 stop:505 length:408 start_codon:yes stop_codon:yes gene_type:complete